MQESAGRERVVGGGAGRSLRRSRILTSRYFGWTMEPMTTHSWDPERYLTYADERGRPFVDLITRIDAAGAATRGRPRLRPGQPHGAARRPLARRGGRRSGLQPADDRGGPARRPRHRVRRRRPARLGAGRAGRRAGLQRDAPVGARPPGPAAGLVGAVAPGGWFAFQVPGNFDEPSHTIRRDLAGAAGVRRAHRRR